MDTNVLSEPARPKANPAVLTWANAQPVEDLYTTAITEAELLYGLACLPTGRRRTDLHSATATLVSSLLAGQVLSFDRTAATQAYAGLAAERRRLGRPGASADLRIAAIALAHRASAIVPRNIRDFADCGLALIAPWQAPIPFGQI